MSGDVRSLMAAGGRDAQRPASVRSRARSRWRIGWIIVVILATALVLLGPVGLGRGERAARRTTEPSVGLRTSDPEFERTLALLTGVQVAAGNRVSALLNGNETFPDMWRELRAARSHIMVQQYFAKPGAVADSLAAALTERARAGVRVRLLLDGHGAILLNGEWRARLAASGVDVVTFRPLGWQVLHRAGNRSHVRLVAIDDEVAYTGGFGFADTWLGDGRSRAQWRETNVRVVGPAADQVRATFAAAWFEATGELLPVAAHRVNAARAGAANAMRAGVFHSAASAGHASAVTFLALAIGSAERRLWIASSYFVPDADLRAMLVGAARRGVDVRILTAGRSTDVKAARFAGRATYGDLLRGGVRMYEYAPTMMHAKTFVVDGMWATVGSMNLDNRSIALNDEVSLIVFDTAFAERMEAVFTDDLRLAHELTLAEFEARSRVTRTLEWLAMLASKLL